MWFLDTFGRVSRIAQSFPSLPLLRFACLQTAAKAPARRSTCGSCAIMRASSGELFLFWRLLNVKTGHTVLTYNIHTHIYIYIYIYMTQDAQAPPPTHGPPPLWPGMVVWFFRSPPPRVACGGGMVLLVPPPWPVVVVCWYVGMLVCWYVGMYVCRYVCM